MTLLDLFKTFDYKKMAALAGKTFVQAFLATFYFPIQAWTDVTAWQSALAAACAAGVSAVWNFLLEWQKTRTA